MGECQARVELESLVEIANRQVECFASKRAGHRWIGHRLAQVSEAAVVVRDRVLGIELDSLAVVGKGARELAFVAKSQAAKVIERRHGRIRRATALDQAGAATNPQVAVPSLISSREIVRQRCWTYCQQQEAQCGAS